MPGNGMIYHNHHIITSSNHHIIFLFCTCMWSICKKELRQFFSSLTGYITIIVFLLANGLVLFVFKDNVLDYGYATLEHFFPSHPGCSCS
ncbi:MAG: hypothetical protein ACXWB9_08205 [Flavisolibacter sp.]